MRRNQQNTLLSVRENFTDRSGRGPLLLLTTTRPKRGSYLRWEWARMGQLELKRANLVIVASIVLPPFLALPGEIISLY